MRCIIKIMISLLTITITNALWLLSSSSPGTASGINSFLHVSPHFIFSTIGFSTQITILGSLGCLTISFPHLTCLVECMCVFYCEPSVGHCKGNLFHKQCRYVVSWTWGPQLFEVCSLNPSPFATLIKTNNVPPFHSFQTEHVIQPSSSFRCHVPVGEFADSLSMWTSCHT